MKIRLQINERLEARTLSASDRVGRRVGEPRARMNYGKRCTATGSVSMSDKR